MQDANDSLSEKLAEEARRIASQHVICKISKAEYKKLRDAQQHVNAVEYNLQNAKRLLLVAWSDVLEEHGHELRTDCRAVKDGKTYKVVVA